MNFSFAFVVVAVLIGICNAAGNSSSPAPVKPRKSRLLQAKQKVSKLIPGSLKKPNIESKGSFVNAKAYKEINTPQRNVIKGFVPELSRLLNWGTGDVLLDIGSGTGDALMDFILPLLEEKKFSQLIGTDISDKMLNDAKKHYSKHTNVAFERLDIGMDIQKQTLKFRQQPGHVGVDHITSFFCLHWIKNQKAVFTNIYNLLKPGGDCLLIFLANTHLFTGYEHMKKREHWKDILPEDISIFIPPYQHSANATHEMETILKECKFSEMNVEVRLLSHVFQNFEDLKDFLKGVTPFYESLPSDKKNAFANEYASEVLVLDNMLYKPTFEERYKSPHNVLIVYAKK